MTTVPATSSTTPPASSAASSTNDAANELSSNFNTFLTLLTAQLQNQDPLQPMDSTQFTQQLVEFSQVEQQIDTNSNLNSLISLTKTNAGSEAVSYLGKTITTTDGAGALQNGQASWTYSLANNAASTTLAIADSTGKVVYVGSGDTSSGAHNVTWNGQDNSGDQLPDGTYTLTVQATASDNSTVSNTVTSQATVTEVDLSGTEPTLIAGALSVPLSQASLISQN